jgi:hypothetical protein
VLTKPRLGILPPQCWALEVRTQRPMCVPMATDKTTSFKKLRKRAVKRARKLTKKARKLTMRAMAAAEKPITKRRKSSKAKKARRITMSG